MVDCGFVKLKWYNADTQTDALVVVPISQASSQQRAGRAGRVKAGKVYRYAPNLISYNSSISLRIEIMILDSTRKTIFKP